MIWRLKSERQYYNIPYYKWFAPRVYYIYVEKLIIPMNYRYDMMYFSFKDLELLSQYHISLPFYIQN